MAYSVRLPDTRDISWLSTLLPSYPATRRDIVRMARKWNLDNSVIMFLRQFDADVSFTSRADFVQRCESLAAKIRREWESPRQISLV